MKITSSKTLIALGLLCFATSSMAQWQWVDRSGRKVFSDQPPPADVPEKNILKRPGGVAAAPLSVVSEDDKASAPAPAASAARAPQPAASEPSLTPEQKKKQKEEEAREAAKRKAEEEKIAKAKQENCQRAKTSLASLKTGMRVRTVNEKGESTVMDDKSRSAEEKRLKDVIARDCK
ncbi:MAG: DUF4124 domain-containing protein [Brachymonas sp.]|nr:DUF4124 domain-containing protein [Brachymonas sp.]